MMYGIPLQPNVGKDMILIIQKLHPFVTLKKFFGAHRVHPATHAHIHIHIHPLSSCRTRTSNYVCSKLPVFIFGENSRFAELLAAMGELSILSTGLPGEGSQAPLRSTRPITGRLTNFSLQFGPIIEIVTTSPTYSDRQLLIRVAGHEPALI
jgi:hypothetical protein